MACNQALYDISPTTYGLFSFHGFTQELNAYFLLAILLSCTATGKWRRYY